MKRGFMGSLEVPTQLPSSRRELGGGLSIRLPGVQAATPLGTPATAPDHPSAQTGRIPNG
jgi:hypothetical protein